MESLEGELDEETNHETDNVADEGLSFQQSQNMPASLLLCKCLLDEPSSQQIVVSERKQKILTTVARTEAYLREHRIPELIRFLLTKMIAHSSSNPVGFLESLLDDSMLFRSGLGVAPVLYEDRHLQAVIKSFDPGNRGWLSAGQVRRAFITLGLTPQNTDDRIPCDEVLNNLKRTQEKELFRLLSAGVVTGNNSSMDDSESEENSITKIK